MTIDARATEEFRRAVRDRLATQADGLVQFFRLLAATPVPQGAARIVIGLYADDLVDSFPAAFGYVAADNSEVLGPNSAERAHSRLKSFKPLAEREFLLSMVVWATDENGEQVPAYDQPWNDVDVVSEFLLPAMKEAAKRADMSGLDIPVYAGAADGTGEVVKVYDPVPPAKAGFWARMKGHK